MGLVYLPTFGCWVGGLKYLLFSPLFGEDSHFDYYFSSGLKPPTRLLFMVNVAKYTSPMDPMGKSSRDAYFSAPV